MGTAVNASVPADARRVASEHASYRWAYLVLSFGILASVAWRGFVRHESSWDLLALVMLGGLVTTLHAVRHGAWTARQRLASALSLGLALALGAVLALLLR